MSSARKTADTMIALIVRAAEAARVPPDVALAFAWCESRFDPTAEGDLDWAERDNGKRYARYVLSQPRLKPNPARDDPKAWHSYGLFQLLACFHVGSTQHPRELLDPEVNAVTACRFIRGLLYRTGGDHEAARLLFVGLPLSGDNHKTQRAHVIANLRAAMTRFVSYAAKPPVEGV